MSLKTGDWQMNENGAQVKLALDNVHPELVWSLGQSTVLEPLQRGIIYVSASKYVLQLDRLDTLFLPCQQSRCARL